LNFDVYLSVVKRAPSVRPATDCFFSLAAWTLSVMRKESSERPLSTHTRSWRQTLKV